jgi:hypothetical protein
MEYLHGSGCGVLLHHESISLEVIDDNVGENNEQKLMNKTDKPNFVAILVGLKTLENVNVIFFENGEYSACSFWLVCRKGH